jgi:hypothetical protein
MPLTSAIHVDSIPPMSTERPASTQGSATHPARDRLRVVTPLPDCSPIPPSRSGVASTPSETFANPRPSLGDRVILPFDRLHCFEDVADCFADLGLHFDNAIALVPSNPRYPTTQNALVIVSAPHNGALEIQFDRPIATLTACVTSSRPMTMSAKNQDAAIITRSRISSANLNGSNSGIPANYPLVVTAPAIYSVTFSAFDGQIAISDLAFSWATPSTQS